METETLYPETPVPDAKSARRAASLCAFAAVALTVIAYAIIFAVSLAAYGVAGDLSADLVLIVNTAAVDLIAMPLCWLLLLRRVPKNAGPERERTPLSFMRLLFFFPCAFVLMYAGSLAGKLIGVLIEGGLSDVVTDAVSAVSPWTLLPCIVIVGPVAEELFFRKAMIDRLSVYHPTDAILFSALLFAMIHGNLTQFLYAFPLGVLFGVIYYRTQNIRYTILLHVAINAIGGAVPVLLETAVGKLPEIGGMALTAVYSLFILAMCVLGLVLLIVRRREFLPIPSENPRVRKPFYINAGFIAACVVFIGLFVASEILS